MGAVLCIVQWFWLLFTKMPGAPPPLQIRLDTAKCPGVGGTESPSIELKIIHRRRSTGVVPIKLYLQTRYRAGFDSPVIICRPLIQGLAIGKTKSAYSISYKGLLCSQPKRRLCKWSNIKRRWLSWQHFFFNTTFAYLIMALTTYQEIAGKKS